MLNRPELNKCIWPAATKVGGSSQSCGGPAADGKGGCGSASLLELPQGL